MDFACVYGYTVRSYRQDLQASACKGHMTEMMAFASAFVRSLAFQQPLRKTMPRWCATTPYPPPRNHPLLCSGFWVTRSPWKAAVLKSRSILFFQLVSKANYELSRLERWEKAEYVFLGRGGWAQAEWVWELNISWISLWGKELSSTQPLKRYPFNWKIKSISS